MSALTGFLDHNTKQRVGKVPTATLSRLVVGESCFAAVGIDRQRLGNEFMRRGRHA
jgi:hypothetical protein